MPWKSSDASKKTRKANSPKKQRQWKAIANSVLEKTGDESRAVRTANGVIKRGGKRKKSRSSGRR